VKVGLIGAGLQARRRARTLNGAELAMIAAANWDEAKLLADEVGCEATANWEEVVERADVEVVIVCTPPHLHAPISIAAMRAGKHVLCEKPLARVPEEAEEIVDVARETKMKLKCGFNLRHHRAIRQAREWLEQGAIGDLGFIRCRYGICGRPGYEKDWRADREIAGGGQLMDQGMHVLDLSRWFMGEFREAFGFLSTQFWNIAPLEDNAFVLLRTEGGQIASIHASWTQWKNLFSFELFGQDGYILVEGLGGSYGTERATLGQRAFLQPFREETVEFRGEDPSLSEEWQEFVAAIDKDQEPLGNGYDGLQALKLACAVYESAEKGCVVKLK